MKKLFIISLALGIALPILAQWREFYYISALLACALVFFSVKKWQVSLIDLLVLFLITIPLHTLRFGTQEHFIRLSEIAFVPLFLWFLAQLFLKQTAKPLTIRKEFIFLAFYLLINIVSARNSIFPAISMGRIAILAYLFLFTYMIINILNSKEKIATIVKASIIISGFSAIIAAFQCIFPNLIIFTAVPIGKLFGITFYRAGVGWHDPNYYALYLGLNASLTLTFILSPEVSLLNRRLLKTCFFLQLIGILSTFSRTILFSLIFVVLYLFYYFGRKKLALGLFSMMFISLIIISVSSLVIYRTNPFLASVIYRVADKEKLKEQPTLIMGHRYAAFKANTAMFIDHPLLGVGPFMAMYNFDKYRPRGYNYPLPWLASHNQYLQLLAEKGIFGFLLFLGFIFVILKGMHRFIKKTTDPIGKTYLIGLRSSVFVYLIVSLSLETSYELQFWLTMGLAMAVFNILAKEEKYA